MVHSTSQGALWQDRKMSGYSKYGVSHQNIGKHPYGQWPQNTQELYHSIRIFKNIFQKFWLQLKLMHMQSFSD